MAPTSPTLFETMSARPPTPPREVDKYIEEALQFLSDSFEVDEAAAHATADPEPAIVNTPPQHSPSSSADQANGSGRRKKVDFSPWTTYSSANDLLTPRRGLPGSPLRPLPQPRDPKTLKSILKAHDPPVTQSSTPTSGHPSNNADNFATMLEGIVKQLAGKSRPHKLDSYTALLETLKTYEGKPDAKVLAEKMGLMAHFMRRDMTATNSDTGDLDLQLALQALKLLMVLMELSPVSERIPEDFRAFFLDKSIEAFGDTTAPKKWVNNILCAFSQQQFGRTMTSERVNRAITALKDIEDRISGNNVAICRIHAYQRLLSQAQSIMVARASDWIQHVFHGMLSTFKDLRIKAMEVGTAAGIAIGDVAQVSRVVVDILGREIDDGSTYGDYFTSRLSAMLSDVQVAEQAPHIWATVILLLRSRRRTLNSWGPLKKWLAVFQQFVNSSNKEVAIQANGAWNRFVYAVRPDESTTPVLRKLLRQAVVAQFDRKGVDKDALRMRRSAFSSYCNLLYYSLSPTASANQLDLYWQEFIVPALPSIIRKDRKGANQACRVLTALFKRSQGKLWKENLAVESPSVSLDHIIALDARWTRQRLGAILPSFELCFASTPWSCNSPSDMLPSGVPVKTMWTALLSAVAEAGSKEVTVSMEFKEACAQIMNFFHRIWINYPKSLGQEEGSEETWIERFGFLVLTAAKLLGPSSFADPILSHNPAGDFEVAPTPSHRLKSHGSPQSPLLHLLQLLTRRGPATIESDSLVYLSGQLLDLCSEAKPSRKFKLELLCNFVKESTSSSDELFKSEIWRKCAQETEHCLRNASLPTSLDRASQKLGEEYRSVVDILICGLDHGEDANLGATRSLYEAFVSRVQREISDGAGVAAVVLAITEPLAERLHSPTSRFNPDAELHLAALVLTHAEHPKHRKLVEQARKMVWGVSSGPQRQTDFGPFNHLYKMIVAQLKNSYNHLEGLRADLVIEFSAVLCSLFERWPVSLSFVLLREVQSGIAVWVEDSEQKLAGDSEEAQGGREAVYTLWGVVMTTIEGLTRHDHKLLKVLEVLVSAGLRSKWQGIANRAIEMWNKTFGTQPSLQYPSNVEKSLRRLRSIVELQLPGFPDAPEYEGLEPTSTFVDAQQDVILKHPALPHDPSPFPRRLEESIPSSPARSVPTPNRRARVSASNSKPKAKLRHDDSQIDFVPIESSPMVGVSLDSQLLINHQKEVRERQNDTAAMFPDISSSPTRHAKNNRLDLPVYSKSGKHHGAYEDEEPRSTPIFNLQEYHGRQDIPSSSPTPRARKDSQDDSALETPYLTSSAVEHIMDSDMPSSPPGLVDENGMPPDSMFIPDSSKKERPGTPATKLCHFGGLEDELDEDMVAQLMGDVSNLSDTPVDGQLRGSSPALISSTDNESERGSSDIDEEVSQQLENEVIAQALRQREVPSIIKTNALPNDTVFEEEQQILHSGAAGDLSVDLLGDDEDISSFGDIAGDLPQGTTGTISDTVCERIALDNSHEALSSTERDASSIDLVIRTSPGKARSLPEVVTKIPGDETIVEDSFTAFTSEMVLSGSTKRSDSSQQPTTKSSISAKRTPGSHKKRKSLTPADNIQIPKRPKRTELSSKAPQGAHPSQSERGSDSGSNGSVLSNITVNTSSLDKEPTRGAKASVAKGSCSSSSLFSQPKPAPENMAAAKEKNNTKPAEPASSPRTSSRLSGAIPEPALERFRKRKSRLSYSQTELDHDETIGVSTPNEEPIEETPAPKRRKGRPSRKSVSQNSSQASNAPSTAGKRTRASISRSIETSPHTSFAEADIPTRDLSELDRTRSGSIQSTSVGGKTQQKKQTSYDKKGVAGNTTALETHASRQTTLNQEPSASQGSTASPGTHDSTSERPKLQPKSIIGRLKRVLSDCRQLVLGREEERELDDVMFDLRREVHQAARRGEESSGN